MPRLGKAGRDREDDVVAAIVVMNRTLHTNDVVPRIKAEIAQAQQRRDTAARGQAGAVLRPHLARFGHHQNGAAQPHVRLHSGVPDPVGLSRNLRSAIIVGVNIPFALFFSIIILVLRGEDANLLSVGRGRFRHHRRLGGHPGREHFQEFSMRRGRSTAAAGRTCGGRFRHDPTRAADGGWTDRLRMIFVSALQVDKAVFFSTAVTIAGLRSAVHDAGRRGPDFQPRWRGPMAMP